MDPTIYNLIDTRVANDLLRDLDEQIRQADEVANRLRALRMRLAWCVGRMDIVVTTPAAPYPPKQEQTNAF